MLQGARVIPSRCAGVPFAGLRSEATFTRFRHTWKIAWRWITAWIRFENATVSRL